MSDREEMIQAQKELCERAGAMIFFEENGNCPKCRKDLYSYMTLEEAGIRLITGCPHCHKSLVE